MQHRSRQFKDISRQILHWRAPHSKWIRWRMAPYQSSTEAQATTSPLETTRIQSKPSRTNTTNRGPGRSWSTLTHRYHLGSPKTTLSTPNSSKMECYDHKQYYKHRRKIKCCPHLIATTSLSANRAHLKTSPVARKASTATISAITMTKGARVRFQIKGRPAFSHWTWQQLPLDSKSILLLQVIRSQQVRLHPT